MAICIHNGILLNGVSNEGLCAVLINDNGKIEDVFSETRFAQKSFPSSVQILDAHKNYIAPGLIDTHIHGFNGNGTDIPSTEGILQMSEDLARYGVTAFNPTMYPSDEEVMIDTIKKIVAAMGHEKGAKIMGIHLEGPFISPKKLGVQKPCTVKLPDIALMQRLWDASEGHIVNMTVAPELKGMRELALFCISKGIILQAGHTDAEYKHMVEGMQVGILHITHFFNAMSHLHHRNPGATGAVLIHPELSCEIIADGVHVHKDLFKLLQRDKSVDKIVLITDCLTPTEQKAKHLFANGEEVLMRGGCFHRKSDDVIAGSALTMIKAVKNTTEYGFALNDSVRFATANPAEIMKYDKIGTIAPGYAADIIIFDKRYNIQTVIINGKIIKQNMKE